jgi:hypothetical protein
MNHMKFSRLFSVIALLCLAGVACAQGGAQGRGTTEATIKGKKVSITYGRPSLKGRDMLSKAPVGTVWRLGANQATEIETAADLKIGNTVLKAGKYSLWAKKTGDTTWVLAFHPKTGVWGQPELKEGYVAELPLTFTTASSSAEEVTITLSENKGNGNVKIQWGTAVLSGDFGVS